MKSLKNILRKSTEYRVYRSTVWRSLLFFCIGIPVILLGYYFEIDILFFPGICCLVMFGPAVLFCFINALWHLCKIMRKRNNYYFYPTVAQFDAMIKIRLHRHTQRHDSYFAILNTTDGKRLRVRIPERIGRSHRPTENFIVGYNSATRQLLTFLDKDEPNLAVVNHRNDLEREERK